MGLLRILFFNNETFKGELNLFDNLKHIYLPVLPESVNPVWEIIIMFGNSKMFILCSI